MKPLLCTAILAMALAGCTTVDMQVLDSGVGQSQMQLRQAQSRTFDTTDKERTLRSVIATLQDLGFVIDSANLGIGTVSGTKLDGYAMRMTVSVQQRGTTQLVVRANAQVNTMPITDPEPYQSFFAALQRAIFLNANAVD